jgi:hypothetical protein
MNDLCAEIGFKSINHAGEELCGDHVEIVESDDGNSAVAVLADGLGSGVQASILSTLTAKIISTMVSSGMSIEQCVNTVASTLPVSPERGVAYSTFTILNLTNSRELELIQYDNPLVIMLRDGKNFDYPTEEMTIGGKKILRTRIILKENDIFIAMSDGCPHAGIGNSYNFGWKRENIIDFMEPLYYGDYTSKNLSTILVDEVYGLYGGEPKDDATALTLKIRKRRQVNLLFGPPADPDDCDRMMSLFFSKEGKHVICGGTTSSIAAKYLGKKIKPSLEFVDKDVPPIAELDGVDLVTEGVITVNKVLQYAQDYITDNELYDKWSVSRDGASLICRLLFEEATDINFFVGRAINPAHQNPDLPINFSIKMQLVDKLTSCLKQMGKKVKVSYF